MAKKFKLRDQFSIDTAKGETIVGPCVVELEDSEVAGNEFKLEAVEEQAPADPAPAKKQKAEK